MSLSDEALRRYKDDNAIFDNAERAKRILITGASSGIGRTIAEHLSKDKQIFFLTGRNEKVFRTFLCKGKIRN